MKRIVFKKWVNWLVLGVAVLSAMSLIGECEGAFMFIITKVFGLGVFYASYKLLVKFGRHEVL